MASESLFYQDDSGVQKLKEALKNLAKIVCKRDGVSIRIDEYVCEEAHVRASETVAFHKVADYSIYKELAHVGYWINRLKPIRIDSPMNTFRTFEHVKNTLDEWTFGAWVKIEKKARDKESDLKDVLYKPINEHIVVLMIMDFVEAHQLAHAETLGSAMAQDYKNAIDDNRKRAAWLRAKIENSLRDHNHSARGFATLVEAMLRTRCETE